MNQGSPTLMRNRNGWTAGVLILLAMSVFVLATTVSGSPSSAALGAFEALRNAEASGANIGLLVSQYNSLLQQSANDSSFNSLQSQILEAQQSASSTATFNTTLTIILVPIIPFFLALLSVIIVRVVSRVERKRKLDMEVKSI